MDNKWTKVQEHPVLECGVMTKEDGQVKVTALFKSNNSTIMVYNKEDNYVFMRTEGGQNWTTSTLGSFIVSDLIYEDGWYAVGVNGTKRFLLKNTASTFDQSNKVLDLPDYSRQVIKINM